MNDPDNQPEPKIIIDDDWKSQAQAEKEQLAQAEASQTQEKSRTGASPDEEGPPPADWNALFGVMVSQALMYLGGMADKKTGGVLFDPELSHFYIELLSVLEEKTRGNLSENEAKDLNAALGELRLRYVELSRAMAQQAAQGAPPGGPVAG